MLKISKSQSLDVVRFIVRDKGTVVFRGDTYEEALEFVEKRKHKGEVEDTVVFSPNEEKIDAKQSETEAADETTLEESEDVEEVEVKSGFSSIFKK